MNTLENKIQGELVVAMKAHNEAAVSALRSIKTAIQNEKVNGTYHELTDDNIVALVQKLAKQRQESIDIYTQAGRQELADKEKAELEVLNAYLPQMLGDEQLTEAINKIIASTGAATMKDMGKVMGALKGQYPNQYDGKKASEIIKNLLS